MEGRKGPVAALELGDFELADRVGGFGFAVVALGVSVVVRLFIWVLLFDVGGQGAMV